LLLRAGHRVGTVQQGLPTTVCTLAAGPIIQAILADLVARQVDYPRDDDDKRLMQF